MEQIDSTLDRVLSASKTRLTSADARHDTAGLQLSRFIDSAHSLVRIYRDESRVQPGIVVKQFRGGSSESPLAECEYKNLKNLADHLQYSDELFVPQPIACLPEDNILVTWEAVGERIDQLFTRGLTQFRRGPGVRELEAHCTSAANWLLAFHRVNPNRATAMGNDSESIRRRLTKALQRVHEQDPRLFRDLPGLRSYFVNGLDRMDPFPGVLHHPDFSPYNMIAGAGAFYVMDVAEIDIGHPQEEIAFFWAYFEALKGFPWISRRRVRDCQRRFLTSVNPNDSELKAFWQRWGVFLRYSYLGRSRRRKAVNIRRLLQAMTRARLRRWLLQQQWNFE